MKQNTKKKKKKEILHQYTLCLNKFHQTKMIYLLLFIRLFVHSYCKDSLKRKYFEQRRINQSINNDNSKFNGYGNGIKKKKSKIC